MGAPRKVTKCCTQPGIQSPVPVVPQHSVKRMDLLILKWDIPVTIEWQDEHLLEKPRSRMRSQIRGYTRPAWSQSWSLWRSKRWIVVMSISSAAAPRGSKSSTLMAAASSRRKQWLVMMGTVCQLLVLDRRKYRIHSALSVLSLLLSCFHAILVFSLYL